MLVRLEMDGTRLMPRFDTLPPALAGLSLILHLALGFGLGLAYFRDLRRGVDRLLAPGSDSRSPAGAGVAALLSTLVRFGLLAGVLTLTSLEGALPLLVTALGLVAARAVATRRMRATAP